MAIRSQFFYYRQAPAAVVTDATVVTSGNVIRTMADTLTQAAITKATEFVVVEKIAATPWQSYTGLTIVAQHTIQTIYMQVVIATTGYFVRPDGITSNGVPSQASPFPRSGLFKRAVFEMNPPVYVLPGQNWELELRPDGNITDGHDVRALIKYTLYDNADSQFAVELFRMGVSVTPANVDEYKRLMLEQQVAEGTYTPVEIGRAHV